VEEPSLSDPLRWWPGKYADCKRIAHLVDDFLSAGEVLEAGGPGVFEDLLPAHRVTRARVADGIDLCDLPYPDDAFDVVVSARVLELLPPHLRCEYLRELLRVSRYRVFVALPLQPELEAIDKIKNAYVWDVPRVWQHPGPRPDDVESAYEGLSIDVVFHVEPPRGASLPSPDSPNAWIEAALQSPAMKRTELIPGLPTPPFVVAEIVKAEIAIRSRPAATSEIAH
jgi:hypothetical protein